MKRARFSYENLARFFLGRCGFRDNVCVVQRGSRDRCITGSCVVQRPTPFEDSETAFVLCRAPPSRLRSVGPPRLTPQPPEGVFYQALSWLLWFAFMARFALCNVPPSRAARSAGPPRLDDAPPGGGLISSAFLASVVRVHGEGGPGQQKANPNAESSSVKATLWGARR